MSNTIKVRYMSMINMYSVIFMALFVCMGINVKAQDGASARKIVDEIYNSESDNIVVDTMMVGIDTETAKLVWSIIIDRIDRSFFRHSKNKVLSIYDVALRTAVAIDNKEMIAHTYCRLAKYHTALGANELAYITYLKCGELFEEIGSTSNIIGVLSILSALCLYMSEDAEAEYYYRRCLEIAQSSLLSKTHSDVLDIDIAISNALAVKGGLLLKQGEYYYSLQCYEDAVKQLKKLKQDDRLVTYNLADNLASIGAVHASLGRNKDALNYYRQALVLARKHFHVDRIARVLNNIGLLLLYQEDYQRAIAHFEESVKIFNAINSKNEIPVVILNIGVAYQRLHEYQLAKQYFLESYEDSKIIKNLDVVIAAGEGLGAIYRIEGNYNKAIDILDRSLSLAAKLDDKVRIAEILWRKAEVHHDRKELDEAIKTGYQSFNLARQLQFSNLAILTATLVAKSLIIKNDWNAAEELLNTTIDEIENQRTKIVGREQSQQLYFENKVTPYHLLIDINVSKRNIFSAFKHAERVKSRVLLDSLHKGRVALMHEMTESDKREHRRLNQIIANLNRFLRAELKKVPQNLERLEQIKTDLADARLKYSIFMDVIQISTSPVSDQGKIVVSHQFEYKLLEELPGDTLFISYSVTQHKTWVFLISNRPEGIELDVKSLEISREDLRASVLSLHRGLAERSLSFNTISRKVYDILIGPIEGALAGRNKLCFIPDDILWDVPFQTLINKDSRYLIENHSVSYAPSLSVYLQMRRKRTPVLADEDNSLLAFGNPIIGDETVQAIRDQQRGDNFEPLPHAELEVKTVVPIFSRGKSMALLGAEAEERVFKAKAGEYRTIHLATHGVLDNQNPLYSYLLLSRKEDDLEEDGILEAREILELDLNADMVVLSACETARGRIGSGEGVVGMAWAFFVAGCRSTIVSQWKVDSEGTAKFMIDFYRAFEASRRQGNPSRAEALRAAALGMMKNIRHRHPYYWAGFVMIGLDN
ncbi:MAG: CHAT domain-containing protein [Acidobacteriota bacterium]|nr:MAG: CHAT domain-containing protein [Acidobacteriota bacterium]